MFSAVVIDDESKVRETICNMLSVYCPNINVIGQAESVASGFKLISDLNPDVVFLDIRMPDGTGFDLLKKFSNINFHFIIISAYAEYALKAFKFSALDYLLKPIDSTDLINAVEKVAKVINSEETNQKFETLIANIDNEEKEIKKIILKTQDSVFVVEINKIIRCESQNNYTYFYFTDNTKVLVSKTLKEYDDLLSPLKFVRCHQSHLVNPRHIVKYVKHPNILIQMIDGSKIPVSVRKKDVIDRLGLPK
jgi:two-component system LytT family response regulator